MTPTALEPRPARSALRRRADPPPFFPGWAARHFARGR